MLNRMDGIVRKNIYRFRSYIYFGAWQLFIDYISNGSLVESQTSTEVNTHLSFFPICQ